MGGCLFFGGVGLGLRCYGVVVLGYWGIGVLGYWGIAMLRCWGVGVLGYWGVGVLGHSRPLNGFFLILQSV